MNLLNDNVKSRTTWVFFFLLNHGINYLDFLAYIILNEMLTTIIS